MEKKRSEGVVILASLALCIGIWSIIPQSYYLLRIPGMLNQMRNGPSLINYGGLIGLLKIIGLPVLIGNILYTIFAYKTLKLKNWARVGLIAMSLIFVSFILFTKLSSCFEVLQMSSHPPMFHKGATVFYRLVVESYHYLIISIFMIVYFTRPKVKEQFR